jgi:hypothetical protein
MRWDKTPHRHHGFRDAIAELEQGLHLALVIAA